MFADDNAHWMERVSTKWKPARHSQNHSPTIYVEIYVIIHQQTLANTITCYFEETGGRYEMKERDKLSFRFRFIIRDERHETNPNNKIISYHSDYGYNESGEYMQSLVPHEKAMGFV